MATKQALIIEGAWRTTEGVQGSDVTVEVTLDEVRFIGRTGMQVAVSHADLIEIVRLCNQVYGVNDTEIDKFLSAQDSD